LVCDELGELAPRRKLPTAAAARALRDGSRRFAGAGLTFRFSAARWLSQWRDVTGAMDRLTAELPHQGVRMNDMMLRL
jgi:hypothetical protein